MTKHFEISSRKEVELLKSRLTKSAERTRGRLLELDPRTNAIQLLAHMKFQEVGCDPLDPNRPLNVIEQLNQTFTYLTSLLAIEYLLEKHPTAAPFTLNLGTRGGWDIEASGDGGVVAEVFAAVNPNKNNKLKKDVQKVSEAEGKHKYVFFMCPDYKAGEQERDARHPEVSIYSVGFDNI